MNPHIQEKVQKLKDQSCDDADYIKRAFIFVRDEIPHSWDISLSEMKFHTHGIYKQI